MTEFLVYDVKAAVLIAVFYLFYRLLLAHETLHRLNRLVLLGTAVVSMVLPLCVITVHHTVVVPAPAEAEVAAAAPVPMAGEVQEPLWLTLLCVVFFLGVVLVLTKTVLSVVRVCMLIKESELHPQPDGITLAVTSRDLAPFSWMHYIVLSRSDYASPDAAILAHERAHIRLRHSVDVLLVDVLTACQWFNPAMWLLRSDLRTIHEYEADAAVLSQGIDARQYQYLLIRKAMATGGYSVANSISHSALKKRIDMMLKHKSSSLRSLKVLYVVPLVLAALAVNARSVTDVVQKAEVQQPSVEAVAEESQVKDVPEMMVNPALPSITTELQEPSASDELQKPSVSEEVVPAPQESEPFTVKGRVLDEKNEPVIGAAIIVRGTTRGTITDMEGRFYMEVSEGEVLDISYIGMSTASVKITKASAEKEITAQLRKDDSEKVTVLNGEKHRIEAVVIDGKTIPVEELESYADKIESIRVIKNDSGKDKKVTILEVSTEKK